VAIIKIGAPIVTKGTEAQYHFGRYPMAYDFTRYLNIRCAHTPTWTGDDTHVLFLSDITGNAQVWRIGLPDVPRAHWPQQLTFFPDKVWEIHGTTKTQQAIAVSDIGGNERQQFYLLDLETPLATDDQGHSIRRLTDADHAIHRFGVWSKDGNSIYYTSNERNNVDFDLYTMSIADGSQSKLSQSNGRRTIVALAPDERAILSTEDVSTTDTRLHLFDLQTKIERPITPCASPARFRAIRWTTNGIYAITDHGHDRGALCQIDLANKRVEPLLTVAMLEVDGNIGMGELDLFTVAPNDQQAALVYNDGGWSKLYLIDLANGAFKKVNTQPEGVIGKLQFSADEEHVVFDLQNADRPQDLWLFSLREGTCRQLTFSNQAGIRASTYVAPELVHYKSFDARDIPALFYQPQQPAPDGGYPCILYVHGGPAGQLRPEFDVRFQYFLGQGMAILATNVRGSSGYGREYVMSDDVALRMDSVRDLYHAVQWLHGQGSINNARIAIYGRSYGGFMVLAALTEYPELFAAGIDVVGIANWVTFLERTSPWRRAHREAEYGSLEHHQALLQAISPIHKMERITMPLMVVAGDNDPRVPLFESEQVVERVRANGGTVEFVHYADEGHKISKLANRIDSFTKMGEFLQHHL